MDIRLLSDICMFKSTLSGIIGWKVILMICPFIFQRLEQTFNAEFSKHSLLWIILSVKPCAYVSIFLSRIAHSHFFSTAVILDAMRALLSLLVFSAKIAVLVLIVVACRIPIAIVLTRVNRVSIIIYRAVAVVNGEIIPKPTIELALMTWPIAIFSSIRSHGNNIMLD